MEGTRQGRGLNLCCLKVKWGKKGGSKIRASQVRHFTKSIKISKKKRKEKKPDSGVNWGLGCSRSCTITKCVLYRAKSIRRIVCEIFKVHPFFVSYWKENNIGKKWPSTNKIKCHYLQFAHKKTTRWNEQGQRRRMREEGKRWVQGILIEVGQLGGDPLRHMQYLRSV